MTESADKWVVVDDGSRPGVRLAAVRTRWNLCVEALDSRGVGDLEPYS